MFESMKALNYFQMNPLNAIEIGDKSFVKYEIHVVYDIPLHWTIQNSKVSLDKLIGGQQHGLRLFTDVAILYLIDK